MKIAICQINPIIGDFEYNISLIKDATDQAKKSGCILAVFPEMCITGYPAKDLLEKPDFIKENIKQLNRLSSKIIGISILCGYVDRKPQKAIEPLMNNVALIKDGKVEAKGGKRLLSGYDVYNETRYFEPCKESLIFELDGKKCGVTICKDTW
ncbi:MAG: NAD+ synthase, partial [Deltaproteobacteria bacterium]|nr:NAD+ synthase [Deltaproteobacteria bacterium]